MLGSKEARVTASCGGLARAPEWSVAVMMVMMTMMVAMIFVSEVAISCVTGELLWSDCCVASGKALPLSGLGLTHLEILVDHDALQWLIAPEPARFAEVPNDKALLRLCSIPKLSGNFWCQ